MGLYEEVVGEIREIKTRRDAVFIVMLIEPKLLQVEVPNYNGSIPKPGEIIGLLRTKYDYRIRIIESDIRTTHLLKDLPEHSSSENEIVSEAAGAVHSKKPREIGESLNGKNGK